MRENLGFITCISVERVVLNFNAGKGCYLDYSSPWLLQGLGNDPGSRLAIQGFTDMLRVGDQGFLAARFPGI